MSARTIEDVLHAHREGALTCYDHPPTPDRPAWCCVCGEHELMVSHRAHVAAKVREWLLSDETVERVARGIDGEAFDARWDDHELRDHAQWLALKSARAALAAATEEPS